METIKPHSKKLLWTGRIISGLCILFLLLDAIMKIVKATPSVEGSVQLGLPLNTIQAIGTILLICTILYTIPRTAIIGAIFLTAYLGGAVAIMLRADMQGHPYFFPIVFGILVWAGLYLQSEKLQTLIPTKQISK